MSPRAFFLTALAVTCAAVPSASCDIRPQATANRVLTATVALSNETSLLIDTVVPTDVRAGFQPNVYAKLKATVTASTSTTAERLAQALEIAVKRDDAPINGQPSRQLQLKVAAPANGALGGTFGLTAPKGLELFVVQRAGTAVLDNVGGTLHVTAAGNVQVTRAPGNVFVDTARGSVLVDALFGGATQIVIKVDQGDILLLVPAALSAQIQALVEQTGLIGINHSRLPPFYGMAGQTYQVTVGGGAHLIQLVVRSGNIEIRERP